MKEINKPFKITYYAKKHGKHITRTGTHDEKCKVWKSKKGIPLYTYFDLDEWGYRTGTQSCSHCSMRKQIQFQYSVKAGSCMSRKLLT